MNDYHFPIRNPYQRTRKLPIALLHFTAGFLLLNGWYEARIGHYPSWVATCFLVLAATEVVFTFFAARLQRHHAGWGTAMRLVTALTFAAYACMLFRDHQWVFGVLMAVIAVSFVAIFYIEQRWKKPFVLRVDHEGLWFPRLFKYQLYPWGKFNHIVLHNNLLTLDFSSNRVVQLDLDTRIGDEESQGFNRFCALHIGAGLPG